MVARGYWNAKQKRAKDLPLLMTMPTLLERITGNKGEKDPEYFVQSPDDPKCFYSAKRSMFDDKVYIIES